MSGRDDGFTRADMDVGYFEDPKVKRLYRETGDSGKACEAVVLHVATVFASWREGRRVTVADAAPMWIGDVTDSVALLRQVGLVDGSGRVSAAGWKKWFDPAYERRAKRRINGEQGGRPPQTGSKPGANRNGTGEEPGANHPVSNSKPDRQAGDSGDSGQEIHEERQRRDSSSSPSLGQRARGNGAVRNPSDQPKVTA